MLSLVDALDGWLLDVAKPLRAISGESPGPPWEPESVLGRLYIITVAGLSVGVGRL